MFKLFIHIIITLWQSHGWNVCQATALAGCLSLGLAESPECLTDESEGHRFDPSPSFRSCFSKFCVREYDEIPHDSSLTSSSGLMLIKLSFKQLDSFTNC